MKKENIENITEKWLDKKAQRLSVLVDLQTLICHLLKSEREKLLEKIELEDNCPFEDEELKDTCVCRHQAMEDLEDKINQIKREGI